MYPYEYASMYRIRWPWEAVIRAHGMHGLSWCIAFKLKERCWWRLVRDMWNRWREVGNSRTQARSCNEWVATLGEDSGPRRGTRVRTSSRVTREIAEDDNEERMRKEGEGNGGGKKNQGNNSEGGRKKGAGGPAKGYKAWRCKKVPDKYTQEIVTWNIQGYSQHV